MKVDIENQGLAWIRHANVALVKLVIGIPNPFLGNWKVSL